MEIDIFFLFRRFLILLCSVYTILRFFQWVRNFSGVIAGSEKHKQVLRRYLALQIFRIRWSKFHHQLLQIAVLVVILSGLILLHGVM